MFTKLHLDSAAVFAAAQSIFESCHDHENHSEKVNLSDEFNGIDELMRVAMTVATEFEQWATTHVAFNELGEVWPYFLGDQFGPALLQTLDLAKLKSFEEGDCLRVATRLGLPLRLTADIVLPINIRALNPVANSVFKELQILAVRQCELDGSLVPLRLDDDADEHWGDVVFGLYGIRNDGLAEHISVRTNYASARDLAVALSPGIDFPEEPIVRLDTGSREFFCLMRPS